MAYNRWIGQAVATQEIKFFVPKNVGAGDRFQFTDGIIRNGYTYPAIPPEVDLTADDRARRVVESLVDGADISANLGGGTSTGLSYSSSNYNGQPAVKVVGLSDGKPIGIVATSVSANGNAVKVQQVQEGSNGKDFVFTLKWPNVPTSGTWAMAANGKQPVILTYNASTEDVRAAIISFGFPCNSINVSGSYSDGYTIRLIQPTAPIANPPVLFPIVPVAGNNAILEVTFYESFSYRFGPAGSGYVPETVFEANITESQMSTYLADSSRLGALASDVIITRTVLTPSVGYVAGETMRFAFTSKASYDAFLAMIKVRLDYTWYDTTAVSVSGSNRTYKTTNTGSELIIANQWKKVREYPHTKGGTNGTLNPFNRSFYTVGWMGPVGTEGLVNQFVINDSLAGYDSTLVKARPQTTTFDVPSVNKFNVAVQYQWTSETFEAWTLAASDVEVWVGTSTSTSPLTFTLVSDGSGSELGVDNNAGWTVETIGTPGIINQEILLAPLDGSFQSLYQFEWDGNRSHQFTGASNLQLIKDAAEALWGIGNVAVGVETGDYFCRIQFVGDLSERTITANLFKLGDGASTEIQVDIEATTPMKAWVLRYRFTGGICSGTWKFVNDTGIAQSVTAFKWLNPTDITAEQLLAAIRSVNSDYETVLIASDIAVVNEDVGRQSILREFTITFQAQPSAPFSGADPIPFWMGIDTTALKTAEPSYETVSLGGISQPEIQVVAIENKPSGGTWALKYNGTQTSAMSWNSSSANVQSALSAIGVSVSVLGGNGGAYRIRWNADGPRSVLEGVNISLTRSNNPSFDVVTIVAGTGPKHYDNADNWTLGRVPIDDDQIVYSDGSVDCSYGTIALNRPKSIDIYKSYGGRIGLPEIRDDGSLETLPNWLTFTGTSGTPLVVRVGLGDSGDGPPICRIAVQNRSFDCAVLYTQTGLNQKAFAIKGTGTKFTFVKGDAALGIRPEDVSQVAIVQITPSQSAGDEAAFLSSAGTSIDKLSMQGGSANFGKPPASMTMIGGAATVNGDGDCQSMDIVNANVRWLANGTLGRYALASQMRFGDTLDSVAYVYSKVRVTSAGHGLQSGNRVYIRAYSGVIGIDGESFSVQVVDADNFDLLGSLAKGTLVGYEGLVAWAIERSVVVRSGAILDFDSDGRTRDVVAPIVIQSSGIVTDSKVTIPDLRLWPEQVDSLVYMGQSIELRRNAR